MSVEISELAILGSLFLCRCDQMPGENREREGRFVSAHGFEVLHHCFGSWFQGSFASSLQKRLGSGNGVWGSSHLIRQEAGLKPEVGISYCLS